MLRGTNCEQTFCEQTGVSSFSLGKQSGKKKEPKPKLLGPDILRWGGGLIREGVGAEKFGMSLETRETIFFFGGI